MELLPEFKNETVESLREMFSARFVQQENDTHFIGMWPPSVRIGKDDYLPIGMIEICAACDKAELEMHRSNLFAGWLLDQDREAAVKAWKAAQKWEPEYFITKTKADIARLKKEKGL